METINDVMPIINGTTCKNEEHFPGWGAMASREFVAFQATAERPFTVEEVRAVSDIDRVTTRISGWGGITRRLAKGGFTRKVGVRTKDDNGKTLRHDLGLWWRTDIEPDWTFIDRVGFRV